ncbi:MAG TPA: hypothetical protein VEL76_34445 [Gemmataceae bacterium]|nr:hypothetical protein [Gemmataceae bacterium]
MNASLVNECAMPVALGQPRPAAGPCADEARLLPAKTVKQRPAPTCIYDALAAHQQSEDWGQRDLLTDLHRWVPILVGELKLEIPEVALTVERLRCTRLGHFQPGHNGFGLRGEIAINRSYVGRHEYWRTLGTLLHELIHAWQQAHGRPGRGNYHNRQFQDKALDYGLVVDRRGCTDYLPDSAFFRLLEKYGVSVPELPQLASPVQTEQGSSKLKKWSCGCTNVRVAVEDFRARCLKPGCGNEFHLNTLIAGKGIRAPA